MLYLIRHGQTIWNREGRKQGHGDPPLTAVGREQARAAGRFLAKSLIAENECKIFCSPLGRAISTAEIICEQAAIPSGQINTTPLLMEADHGDWEGLTSDEIESKHPGALKDRKADHWNYRFPSGESYRDVAIRVERWAVSVRGCPQAVVVTHEMVSRCIRGCYLKLAPMDCLGLDHPQDTVFILEGGSVIEHRCVVGE